MNPLQLPTPEEEKEILLPKSCYFLDGKTKVDYVIVIPKLDERIRGDRVQMQINQFVSQMKDKGLLVERDVGKFYTTLVFLKIHAPHKALLRHANIYNVQLTCQNPYYKYRERICNLLTTELTKPNPESEVYRRAEKTLSGKRPASITTFERSQIVLKVLSNISFLFEDDEITFETLLDKEIFLQAYAIHDGDGDWTDEGPLTDRQLLCKYWANLRYIFREQPIHLIEKYYGPKLSFYFALVSFYTKMLMVPTVLGLVSVLAGVVFLQMDGFYIEEEVCKSNIVLCSDQQLKTACELMKLAYVIDNPVTVVYVVICSFWGAIFWNLWQRRQAMLRLRWNLMGLKIDRTMRPEFQATAKTRRSSITGEKEYYIPPFKKVLSFIFSYIVIFFMVLIYFVLIFLVIQYRFLLRTRLDYDTFSYANEIELFTSTIITTIIIIILNTCVPLVLSLYSTITRFLTLLRVPRTQLQYDRMNLHMTFVLTFANHFCPLFYLAYIKGFLHTYPGDVSNVEMIARLQSDLCKPAGCLVDLGMQLITIMIITTGVKIAFDLVEYLASILRTDSIPKDTQIHFGQWEKDYARKELDDSTINEMYTDMVLQYSFIAFFNSSLPVIGLIALLHNLLKMQHDAYRFLRLYRRPVLDKAADIQGWNHILRVVTVVGTISNAFVVAFRSDFILRFLYRRAHDNSLVGYVNSTLSKFAIKEYQHDSMIIDHENATNCFYRGFRYPPSHKNKYQPTEQYWHHLAVKALYFIILENFTLILSLVLSYIIPEIPRKVKVKLEHDEKVLKAAREAQKEETTK